jgi:glycosyltransferase involved in cell wall biosynthesis
MANPKVSVCIPTYNSARYLPTAIESVLAQEFTDYELIICDNASTDETQELCRSYPDPRIRYVRFDELVGQGGNWNRCLRMASGEYVALLHADDQYLPQFLTERVRTLDQNAEVGLAFGAVFLMDGGGARVGDQIFRNDAFVSPAPQFYGELLFGCAINPVSPMVRRVCYQAVEPFRENRTWGIDWEMWMRLSARYAVAYSPDPLAVYRIHDKSGTAEVLATATNGREDLELIHDALLQIERDPALARFAPLRRSVLRTQALRTLCNAGYTCTRGNSPATRQHLRLALQVEPALRTRPTTWALWLSCYLGPWVYRSFQSLRGSWASSGLATSDLRP